MNEQNAGLVPRLRFPEFREEGEWKEKPLEKLCEVLNNRRKPITSSNRESGPYPYYGASGIVDYVADYIFDERLVLIGEDGAKWGAYEKTAFIAEGKYWVNNHAHVLKPHGVNDVLLEAFLTMIDLGPYITGAAPPKLTLGKLKKILINLPPSLLEQQKIASCLSSLDALITAQADKLAALKTHKKGLMQQLFPREGETVPRLRFPEFREAGEWIKHFLIDTASEKLSNGVFNDPDKVGRGCKLINVIDMYIEPYIDEERLSLLDIGKSDLMRNKVISGDIFFTRSSLVKEGIAQSNIYLGSAEDITFDGHLVRLRPNKNIVIYLYLHYALKSNFARSQLISKGKTATMTTIGQSDIADTIVWIPKKEEQQKIASCLSSLDALIAAQSGKLDALKTHKKGLMQQLFPRETREIPAPVHRDQEPNPLKGSVTFEKDILSPIGDTWDADR